MFKSKKAQVTMMAIFVILAGMAAIMYAEKKAANTTAFIGEKQVAVLNAYSEAEEMMEYAKQASQYSAFNAAKELSVDASSASCFEGLTSNSFKQLFEKNMQAYLSAYSTSYSGLEPKFPEYSYTIIINPGSIEIKAVPADKIIINCKSPDFTYKIGGAFDQSLSCGQLRSYLKVF